VSEAIERPREGLAVGDDPLADFLHELELGCDYEPRNRFDVGMGYDHMGNHLDDAKRLRTLLREPDVVQRVEITTP
jgi:hypothetical protein